MTHSVVLFIEGSGGNHGVSLNVLGQSQGWVSCTLINAQEPVEVSHPIVLLQMSVGFWLFSEPSVSPCSWLFLLGQAFTLVEGFWVDMCTLAVCPG